MRCECFYRHPLYYDNSGCQQLTTYYQRRFTSRQTIGRLTEHVQKLPYLRNSLPIERHNGTVDAMKKTGNTGGYCLNAQCSSPKVAESLNDTQRPLHGAETGPSREGIATWFNSTRTVCSELGSLGPSHQKPRAPVTTSLGEPNSISPA